MRLFVGIELPEDVRERLALLGTGLRGAKWVRPESLHVSLRFIGEVDGGTAAEIDEALMRIRAPSFDLVLSGAGHFESGGQVRVLWIGIERNPRLMHLHDKVEAALVREGLEPEPRKFHPHVTLARCRDTPFERASAFIAANNLFRALPIPVRHFTLFSSHSSAGGNIYRPEAAYDLEGDVTAEGL